MSDAPKQPDCPSDAALLDWYLGGLPQPQAGQVAAHVTGCAACAERARTLEDTESAPVKSVLSHGGEAGGGGRLDLRRGTTFGRFLVLEQIGHGGMGVVYAAFDPVLERKVALKLLHLEKLDTQALEEARARLLREAQAIARLSHPNVVTLFDAGEVDGQIFLAMELIEGVTLRAWQRASKRPWHQVLDKYLAAGRGLVAAHTAGVVHRDFKPANVLVGDDNRVRVLDFGLARGTDEAPLPAARLRTQSDLSGEPSESTLVTRQGRALGTPAYMAPEQLGGERVDARADQFSFCASLYEALYGTRPFPAPTQAEALQSMRAGHLQPPLHASGPRALRRILARGLSCEPAARYPSMQTLVAELQRVQRRGGLRTLARWAVPVLLLVAAASVPFARQPKVCTGAEARLVEVWSPERRAALERRLGTVADPAVALIDEYARRWVSEHTEACLATRVRGEQTEAVLAARMHCLERSRRELDAAAHVLEGLPPDGAARVAELASSLTPLAACGALEVTAVAGPPSPPAHLAPEVERLQRELELLAAQRYLRTDRLLEDARALLVRAEELGFEPLVAQVLDLILHVKGDTHHLDGAEEDGVRAVTLADKLGLDELRLRAEVQLSRLYGLRQRRVEQGERHLRRAFAVLDRMNRPLHLDEALNTQLGMLRFQGGRYAEAEAHFGRSLELETRLGGPDHPRLALLLNNLAQSQKAQGRFAEAEDSSGRALELLRARVGEAHRWTQVARYSRGTLLLRMGRPQPALAEFLALNPRLELDTIGAGGANLHLRVSLAHLHQDRLEEAERALRAAEQWIEAHATADDAVRQDAAWVRAEYLVAQGRLAQALPLMQARLAEIASTMGQQSTGWVESANPMLRALLEHADLAGAHALASDIRAQLDGLPARHPAVAEFLALEQELRWRQGERADCAGLEGALNAQLEVEPDPARYGRARFALYRCLVAIRADKARLLPVREALERDLRHPSPALRKLRDRLGSR
jgi:eukaryotic-like serine/threonine-protein kinase